MSLKFAIEPVQLCLRNSAGKTGIPCGCCSVPVPASNCSTYTALCTLSASRSIASCSAASAHCCSGILSIYAVQQQRDYRALTHYTAGTGLHGTATWPRRSTTVDGNTVRTVPVTV
eukprot:13187-Heterococcus_DN1.PRE.3